MLVPGVENPNKMIRGEKYTKRGQKKKKKKKSKSFAMLDIIMGNKLEET